MESTRPSLSTTIQLWSKFTPKRASEWHFALIGATGQSSWLLTWRKDVQTYLAQEELATVSVDADEGNGELAIKVPEELQKEMDSESNN